VRDELERVAVPGEAAARDRAWDVVRTAFGEREPVARPSHWPRVAAVAVAVAALVAATASPPGQAVLDEIREAVGVERAEQALFSLPAPGRLLVTSDEGAWVVGEDGSKRVLGDYREASWSPFGRFVVATGRSEVAALEPDGDVRWTLARPGARMARWGGTETDTRVAYVDRSGLRVVAGDGTGDRLLVPRFRGTFAWRPGEGFELALATARGVRVVDTATGRTLWRRAREGGHPTGSMWSANGRRLLVVSPRSVTVYDAGGATPYELGPGAARVRDAVLAPDGSSIVLAQETRDGSSLWIVPRIRPDAGAARQLFAGDGEFDELAWSPDGSWVLATWPAADQWVFLRGSGTGIRAVANVSEQFRSRTPPRVEGWCCAAR
jgi:hypothetical protein